MSVNCIKCVVSRRTGPDLLCDDCRAGRPAASELIKHNSKLWERRYAGGSIFLFFCPGCNCGHTYQVGGRWVIGWAFKGSIASPTFEPSLKRTGGRKSDDVCHLNITDGQIIFHGDCTHAMRGQIVPMVEIPTDYGF